MSRKGVEKGASHWETVCLGDTLVFGHVPAENLTFVEKFKDTEACYKVSEKN